MKTYLIVGQTNVGKTAFALGFAASLGLRKVEVTFMYPDGFATKQLYPLAVAREELVGPRQHKTRSLQSLVLQVPIGKGHRLVKIVDSTGLVEGVHADKEIRRSLTQTLQAMQKADFIIHIIDAAEIGQASEDVPLLTEVERQVAAFAQIRGNYLVVANKMDLAPAKHGLDRLHTLWPNVKILPVSAQDMTGFKEVRAVVARLS
ncbi:MAG: GTPase domain-containing protein [Peptococcaceae bacterium]|nr:GTPase domain-containing protein [Peptococcaceae bacterium]